MSFTIFLLLAATFWDGEPVTIIKDSRVDDLVKKHIVYNRVTPVEGFRINIFSQSGNYSRNAALTAQNRFSEMFPNMKSYVSFEEPHFKVKVGNFRTRLEANDALEELQEAYPNAYVVKEELDLKNLLKVTNEEE